MSDLPVLVTGATGYVGGRLVPALLEAHREVRVLVRSPEKLKDVPWANEVDIIVGDLDDRERVEEAVSGVGTLYYLVHAMGSGSGFEAREAATAQLVADAAAKKGIERIVYLGGLHPENAELSEHMRSRTRVGKILLDSATPTVAYQAGVVIGSGSASFEMIRHLADILPVMPAPRWVSNRIEPIAIRDVLHYLVGALNIPADVNRTFDIGSRNALTYADMMKVYAQEAGLSRRRVIALPVLTPWLAAQWVNLVTPIPRVMALPLIQSLQHEAIAGERDIDEYVPPPAEGLIGYRNAVGLALEKMRSGSVLTSWAGASGGQVSDPLPSDPEWAGHTVYTDLRTHRTEASPAAIWKVIEGIGGGNGWYSWSLAWSVRGWLDKVGGGVGLRRGRRHPEHLLTGDTLDFWRVEEVVRGEFLRLRAEMKLPGRAWLELEVHADGSGSCYCQRAIFFPSGLAGRLYWLGVLPFHGVIFAAMARNIAQAASDAR